MRIFRYIALGFTTLILTASLVVFFSPTTLRYVWRTTYDSGEAIWIGDGGYGYVGYAPITPPGSAPRWYDRPLGWTLGEPLGQIGILPDRSMGVFGVRYRTLPVWPITAACVALFLFLIYARPLRRLARISKLQCPKCGYLLLGNEGGRCPECGKEIPETLRRRLKWARPW